MANLLVDFINMNEINAYKFPSTFLISVSRQDGGMGIQKVSEGELLLVDYICTADGTRSADGASDGVQIRVVGPESRPLDRLVDSIMDRS